MRKESLRIFLIIFVTEHGFKVKWFSERAYLKVIFHEVAIGPVVKSIIDELSRHHTPEGFPAHDNMNYYIDMLSLITS